MTATLAEGWEPDQIELAWAAGFYDGEGSTGFTMITNGRGDKRYRNLWIKISQCDREVLDRFHQAVGGLGYVRGPYPAKNINHRPAWRYDAGGFEQVQLILGMIDPYLGVVKRQQAAAALEKYHANPHGVPM